MTCSAASTCRRTEHSEFQERDRTDDCPVHRSQVHAPHAALLVWMIHEVGPSSFRQRLAYRFLEVIEEIRGRKLQRIPLIKVESMEGKIAVKGTTLADLFSHLLVDLWSNGEVQVGINTRGFSTDLERQVVSVLRVIRLFWIIKNSKRIDLVPNLKQLDLCWTLCLNEC